MMLYALMLTLSSCVEVTLTRQDLVFSVELHLGRIPYPLSLPLDPYPLVMFLSRNLGGGSSCSSCSKAKMKSTPSPMPKTGVQQKLSYY